jgi:hypothetical protein
MKYRWADLYVRRPFEKSAMIRSTFCEVGVRR